MHSAEAIDLVQTIYRTLALKDSIDLAGGNFIPVAGDWLEVYGTEK